MKFTFTPKHQTVSYMHGQVSSQAIHTERMYFGASPGWIRTLPDDRNQLTRRVLDLLTHSGEMEKAEEFCRKYGKWLVVDTRGHMLMPGMHPAIPGWHCDAYPRHSYNGQPDLHGGHPDTPHYTMHLSTDPEGLSRTVFANEPLEAEVDNNYVWQSVHGAMASAYPGPATKQYNDGELVRFMQPTLHRAESARTKGWRWWFRMSAYYKPPPNEIRKQVQVYATAGGGW